MKNQIKITVPNPCHESWDKMTPADKGRFCASCQKNVRDFTRASDREILEALKTGGQACGRFRASQLNRDLYVPKEKSKFWAAAGAVAITLLTVGMNEVAAQTPVSTEQHERKNESLNKKVETDSTKIISGVVLDSQGMPIPAVTVKVIGRQGETMTDFDGNFSIEADPGQKLEFSYVTMKTQIITISQTGTIPVIYMADSEDELSVGLIITSVRHNPHIGVASQYMFDY